MELGRLEIRGMGERVSGVEVLVIVDPAVHRAGTLTGSSMCWKETRLAAMGEGEGERWSHGHMYCPAVAATFVGDAEWWHRMIRCGAGECVWRYRRGMGLFSRYSPPPGCWAVAVNAREDLSGEVSEMGRQVASRSGSSLRGDGRDLE